MKYKIVFVTLLFCSLINAQTSFNFGWANGFGSANDEYAYQTKVDATGNIYVTGALMGTVDFDPGVGTSTLTGGVQCFIAKYSSNGSLIWAKAFEDIGNSVGHAIGFDATGNVYVSGYFNGTIDFDPGPGTSTVNALGGQYLFFTKLDPNGNFVWNNTIGALSSQVNLQNMNVNSAGDIVMVGDFNNTIDFDASIVGVYNQTGYSGSNDVFIMKYNNAGTFQWAISIGEASADRAYGVDLDPAGNIYVAGEFQGVPDFDPSVGGTVTIASNGAEDIFLAKYSPLGNYLWASTMGGTAKDQGLRVNYNAAGEVLVTGNMISAVLDADPSIATYTLGKVGTVNDIFLGKYNATTGALIWAKNTGGTGAVGMGAYAITSDAQNNIYLAGFFDGPSDFDFTPAIITINPLSAGADIFLAKYDNQGNYILAKNIGNGTGSGNEAYGININSNNEIILSGNFINTPDFDFSGVTYTQTSVGGRDFFLAKYIQCINPTTPTLAVNSITVCGAVNPTTLTISSGTLNSAANWVWGSGACGTSTFATGNTVAITPTVSTNYFVRGEGGCVIPGACASISVTVLPFKNITGLVTTGTLTPVAGIVTLYKYEGGFQKYDSLTSQTLDALGNFTFTSRNQGNYILKATPTATNLQTTYASSAISWKGAAVLNHGCITNTVQNINVVALTNLGTGPGVLQGTVLEGLKYGQKGAVVSPGGPIKGISVKCGRNPGGDAIAQGTTDPSGQYYFSNLPLNGPGESYFILVDIPGLDTNGTYHKVLSAGTNTFINLDFVADSAKITPGLYVGIKKVTTNNAEINIYPNPTNGILNFEVDLYSDIKISVSIHDVLGKEIMSTVKTSLDKKFQIDLSGLNEGLYFMNMIIGNEKRTTKIIKAK